MEISAKNHSARCGSDVIPSIPEYLSATNVYGITLVTIGSTAVIVVFICFLDTLNYVMKNSSSTVKAHTAFVIAVYPVVALACYFAILVPRAHLLAEAVTQGVFMAAMYQLFCLFMAYCGGEAELIRKVKPQTLSMQVFPVCCCCFCLPLVELNKNTVRRLRLLVIQLPIVQGLVYLILLIMWAERESLYQVNYMYLQPVIGASILFGIWSMAMTVNLLKRTIGEEFRLAAKFLVLQMVLILAKSQGVLTRCLVWTEMLPCRPPITPAVYGNLIHNTLMLSEMVLLALVARKLYKTILPDIIGKTMAPVTAITTIGELFKDKNGNTLIRQAHVNVALDVTE